MTTYVALLRGIGPINPNMRPAKLKWGFEEMGFKNVRTVISSGNVVFESSSKSEATLKRKTKKKRSTQAPGSLPAPPQSAVGVIRRPFKTKPKFFGKVFFFFYLW